MSPRPQDSTNLPERFDGILEMLEHPQANDQVERLVDERHALADAADHRHALRPMLGQRRRVGIEACGELDLAPEELDDTAPAAAQVEDAAAGCDVAAHHRLELVAARFPPRTDRAVALP